MVYNAFYCRNKDLQSEIHIKKPDSLEKQFSLTVKETVINNYKGQQGEPTVAKPYTIEQEQLDWIEWLKEDIAIATELLQSITVDSPLKNSVEHTLLLQKKELEELLNCG